MILRIEHVYIPAGFHSKILKLQTCGYFANLTHNALNKTILTNVDQLTTLAQALESTYRADLKMMTTPNINIDFLC